MNKIALPTHNGFQLIRIADIIRCEAKNNYTNIVLADGQQILVSRRLKTVEQALKDFDFVRVHHSHMVNLDYVSHYIRNGRAKVYLSNGEAIEVSRTRKKDLLNKVNCI